MLIDKYFEHMKNQQLNITRNFTFLSSSIQWNIGPCFEKVFPNIFPMYLIAFTKEDEEIQIFSWSHTQYACTSAFNQFWDQETFFSKLFEMQDKEMKLINKLYEELTLTNMQSQPYEKLVELVKKIVVAERNCNAYGWFSLFGEADYYKELAKKVNVNISDERLDELIKLVSETPIDSFEARNRRLVNKLYNGNIKEIYEPCEYMFTRFNGLMKKEEALEELQKMIDEPLKTFEEHTIETNNEDEEKFVYFIKENMIMRDRLSDYVSKTITIVYRLAKIAFAKANISDKYLDLVYMQELFDGYETLNEETIKKRGEGHVILLHPDETIEEEHGTFNETYEQISKYVASFYAHEKNNEEIKGQPACKGIVTGKVKVIMNLKAEGHKFEEGDILVTGMTRPEFVPLMKQASAIITNEGGITCHAAIVSRELGVPCIIGTKFASEILKDGDLVEVDANTGVVRKL